jgi:D-alanine-D-alanine ligase
MVDRSQRIGVLMGGMSTEREVSLKSGHAVEDALRERGWTVVAIDVGRDLSARLTAERVDVAWLALHGRFGEDGCVQGLCEVMGIPYTGSGVRASAVCMDKIATKAALQRLVGVRMAAQVTWRPGAAVPDVAMPVAVKPSVGGSTIGIHRVDQRSDLEAALADAAASHPEVLVEEWVAGDEITVAVLDGVALPVVRILPVDGFFDFEAKYTPGRTVYEAPAQIAAEAAETARRAAEAAVGALGCSGLCRVDFIVPSDGSDPVLLEVNTLPGMTPTSLSPMAAAVVGMTFGDLVERILLGAHVMAPDRHVEKIVATP